MKKATFLFLGLTLAPAAALAQSFLYTDRVVNAFQYYLERAIVIIMIAMTLWFLWGVFVFIREKDAAKIKEARTRMINGLIGLFVAVAVWGIIRIVSGIVGVGGEQAPNLVCPPGFRAVAGQCIR